MKNNVGFIIKQYVKMFFQHVFLPAVYGVYRHKPVKKNYIILADAHHDSLPFSMSAIRRELFEHPEMDVKEMFRDFSKHSVMENTVFMIRFMREYAQAQTVILCDDFLPAAACRKRKGTKVIQLWHACGAFKKFGCDSDQDIPSYYMGSVTANWNMVTVSSPVAVLPFASAFGLPERRIRPVGVSRTDEYYDEEFNEMCRRRFYSGHPGARGKKIVLWAPTFRGNAAEAGVEGLDGIRKAMEALGGQYYFVIKLHPHSQRYSDVSNCSMPTEELLCVADILVTDYSSILFDAMIYKLPIILYTPDYDKYDMERGFYLNYDSIPAVRAYSSMELIGAIQDPKTLEIPSGRSYRAFFDLHMSGCDGNATKRIMKQMIRWNNSSR